MGLVQSVDLAIGEVLEVFLTVDGSQGVKVLLYLRIITVELGLNEVIGLLGQVDGFAGSKDIDASNFTLGNSLLVLLEH